MAKDDESRRSFLRHMLAGSTVAVTAAGSLMSSKKARAVETKTDRQPDEVLYRETDAFKKYYKTLR